MEIALWILAGYVLLSIVLLPIQYHYLKENTAQRKKLGLTQEEYYEKMSFESEQLHYNVQSNLLFFGANVLASFLYSRRHK